MKEFYHKSLRLTEKMPIAYTALSKRLFYFREQISTDTIQRGYLPLNPFMLFNYFLNEKVKRDSIRKANNTLVRIADELWVFGDISKGVLQK